MNRLTALSLASSAAAVSIILAAPRAEAHTGQLTADTQCRTEGGWQVTWTARNAEAGQPMTAIGFTPSVVPALGTATLTQAFPASQASATLTVNWTWPDLYSDPHTVTVTAPTGCVTTTTVPVTSTTVATTTTQPPVASTTVATTVAPPTTQPTVTTQPLPTTTTHPEYVTDDPQTLPATGTHTLGLIMVAGGLIGLGAWCRRWAKERS